VAGEEEVGIMDDGVSRWKTISWRLAGQVVTILTWPIERDWTSFFIQYRISLPVIPGSQSLNDLSCRGGGGEDKERKSSWSEWKDEGEKG